MPATNFDDVQARTFSGAMYGNAGADGRLGYHKPTLLTMTGGVQAKAQITLPAGSTTLALGYATPAAFSGTPTNVNLRIGSTDGAADIVADIDVKAQSNGVLTIAATGSGFIVNTPTTLYAQITAVGGTAVAGSVQVRATTYAPTTAAPVT